MCEKVYQFSSRACYVGARIYSMNTSVLLQLPLSHCVIQLSLGIGFYAGPKPTGDVLEVYNGESL